MHEMTIGNALLDSAVRCAHGCRVEAVHVRVGHLRQVERESLAFWFGVLSRESLCDGAELRLEDVPARLQCVDCGEAWDVEKPVFQCPECCGRDVVVLSGEELEIDEILLKDEPPCTG